MSSAIELLRSVFGYPSFRGAQAQIIEHVMGGGDALVLMPTGGGKSLCYQIPALIRPGVAIVISPLIALMQDQVDALLQLGVRAAFLNSSQDATDAQQTLARLHRGELDLLYVAPERLLTDTFLATLGRIQSQHGIALFAIDEAHCVSQWGHDFRPEYIQLSILHERFAGVPRIALTATADSVTRGEIIERLALSDARVFVASFDRPNIRYSVTEKLEPRKQLLAFLRDGHLGQSGIVYCLSRQKVQDTAAWLSEQGCTALPYHAGMDAASRRTHQRRFVSEDGVVMVATIAFGMGIDKPDVRFVAHLDLPKSLEGYYQETGRAGRDGEPASAWMIYGLADLVLLRGFIDNSEADEQHKRVERMKLDAMLAYCETAGCRRALLLNYFGEAREACGNCDTCLQPPQTWDGTVAAQKLLSACLRTGQRFGAVHLIDIVRGHVTDKVKQFGHDRLPTFGVGADLDENAWRSVIRQLVVQGFMSIDAARYGALQLQDSARGLLRGETKVTLRHAAPKPKLERKARTARATAELAPADSPLFDALRTLRKELAERQGVPAYVILHDSVLRDIAHRRPRSEQELGSISGIGAHKLARYGAEILRLLAQWET